MVNGALRGPFELEASAFSVPIDRNAAPVFCFDANRYPLRLRTLYWSLLREIVIVVSVFVRLQRMSSRR
jgi:hypothetical protein